MTATVEVRGGQRRLPEMQSYGVLLANGRVSHVELEGGGPNHFVHPATARKLPKIYAVTRGKDVIYVGYTTQPTATRLRQGLVASGEHGYYGYAWKDWGQVGLTVWFFPGEPAERIEAIEAELVYLIRHRTGQWPEAQTEIHFHRVSADDKRRAEVLFESLTA